MSAWIRACVKRLFSFLGILDYAIFVWEDQIKRFSRVRLSSNLRLRLRGAPDGLPIPPDFLIWQVVGSSDVNGFLESGALHAQVMIKDTLQKNGLCMESFGTVLDFGCGCGRIMRYWRNLHDVQLVGSDCNPAMIRWCCHNLRFAHFRVNKLAPPLGFPNDQFDFVYARSVFTHLSEDLQLAWLRELGRVLNQAGYLLLTVSGDQFLGLLSPDEVEQYRAGRLVVRAAELEGKNYCAAYHPPSYINRTVAREGFRLQDYIPGDSRSPYTRQDVYLLQIQ